LGKSIAWEISSILFFYDQWLVFLVFIKFTDYSKDPIDYDKIFVGCLVFNKLGSQDCEPFARTTFQLIKDYKPDLLIVFQRYATAGSWPIKLPLHNDHYFNMMQLFFTKVQPFVRDRIFIARPMVEFPYENGPLEASKRLEYGMNLKSMGIAEKVQSFYRLLSYMQISNYIFRTIGTCPKSTTFE
jgi:hypothetical protein